MLAEMERELADVVARAREQFPDATKIKPVWAPKGAHNRSEYLVEVWYGPRAKVVCPS